MPLRSLCYRPALTQVVQWGRREMMLLSELIKLDKDQVKSSQLTKERHVCGENEHVLSLRICTQQTCT